MKTNRFRLFFGLTVGLLAVAAFAGGFFLRHYNRISKTPKTTGHSVSLLAAEVVQKCSTAESRQRCYDDQIPRLMDQVSMEDAFAVTKEVQSADGSYWFCHALAHKLSAREYQKDPSRWKDVMTRCPSGMCSNGCLHGAIQEHFSKEVPTPEELEALLPDLSTLCEPRQNWAPTPEERASCYHELGHLSLYLANASPSIAKHVCDAVAVKADGSNFLQTCYEGIFMQVFEPREVDDFSLIYPLIPLKENLKPCEQYEAGVVKGACYKKGWAGKVASFCDTFSGELRNACFREAWVIDDQSVQTPQGILNYCNYSSDKTEQRLCRNKLYYSLMASFEFDEVKMKALCSSMPQEYKGQCFANTASRLLETDKGLGAHAMAVCAAAEKFGVAKDCYEELSYYATFVFAKGDPAAKELCGLLPEQWRASCFDKVQ